MAIRDCPWLSLNNLVKIPAMGLGVAMIEPGVVMDEAIEAAVAAGYRLFDVAAFYGNEEALGSALRKTGISRDEIFVSTKLRNSQQSYEDALKAFDLSLKTLQLDYLDMYLIHWPCPAYDRYREAWRALEHLYESGLVRAIGVSNFNESHLEQLLASCDVAPVVDQLECNPYLSISSLRRYCMARDIRPEAWFPLGGPLVPLKGEPAERRVLDDPVLASIGERYGKSPAQTTLRWHVQSGIVPVPKSSRPSRLRENISIFDFELTAEEMKTIDGLDFGQRLGPDPDTCNDQF